jgi:hypothetical protein
MRRLVGITLVVVFAVGVLAALAPITEAGGPKVCPLIECGTCYQMTKVPGQKCPVCAPVPGCVP